MKITNDVRGEIERNCNVFLGWTVPASQMPSMIRFNPVAVSDFLGRAVPSLSIGAANNYIWSMAFAETREVASLAFRNLYGLLPADFGGEDFSKEQLSCQIPD